MNTSMFPLLLAEHKGSFWFAEAGSTFAEETDFLLGISLGHHLARHLGPALEVPADERRIDRAHEGIVDLEVAQQVDALALHEIQRAAAIERPQRSAVSVGRQRDSVRGFEQDFPVEVHRRHPALAEKMHPRRVEAEKFVRREKRLGRRVVRMTRHDEPVQRLPVTPASGEDFFREHLKERLPQNRRDGKSALRAVVAETSPLPACHRESSDAARAQRRLARSLGARPCASVATILRPTLVGRGREALEVRARRTLLRQQGARESLNFREVDLGGLGEELLLLRGVGAIKKGEDLTLPGARELLDQRMMAHGAAQKSRIPSRSE